MPAQIQTRWHKGMEAVIQKRVAINMSSVSADITDEPALNEQPDHGRLLAVLNETENVPKFVISPDLWAMSLDTAMTKSLEAMHKAGVAKLPFPDIIVEFQRPSAPDHRAFIRLRERDPLEPLQAVPGAIENRFHRYRADIYGYKPVAGQDCFIIRPSTVLIDFDAEAGDERVFGWHYFITPSKMFRRHDNNLMNAIARTHERDVQDAGNALGAIVLLMTARGIEKEAIDPPIKLNTARIKRGDPAVPKHTVLRIGHVYNRRGETVRLTEANRGSTVIRWVQGHYKTVHYGEKWSKSRVQFIEPYLVNFTEGAPVPVPNYVVKP